MVLTTISSQSNIDNYDTLSSILFKLAQIRNTYANNSLIYLEVHVDKVTGLVLNT